MTKMQEAKAAVADLLENARTGNIIPVRLPGQVEEIQDLLNEVDDEHQQQVDALRRAPGGDAGEQAVATVEFFKSALHDLKNPLASIKGYADLLHNPQMAGELNEMQLQLLEVIRTNTRRMEGLLADISTLNRLRANMLNINPKMDMFKNIAMMVEKQTQPLADELNRQLEFDIPQGLPLLQTDGERLTEALVKLVENGLRYSPEETGKVSVSASGEGSTLKVVISDNGIGMSEDDLTNVGKAFWRADHELVRSYKGSGLGLAIAYGIVDQLGGTLDVESTQGVGTQFTFRLEGMT